MKYLIVLSSNEKNLTTNQKADILRRFFSRLSNFLYENTFIEKLTANGSLEIQLLDDVKKIEELDFKEIPKVFFLANNARLDKETIVVLNALVEKCNEQKIDTCDFTWL